MDSAATHLAFIGMAGAGKSAIARRVARHLGRRCVDLDAVVSANRGGVSISAVFAEIGEDGFRELESAALADALAEESPVVIATGGGIVERAANREMLARDARVVWLSATDEVLVDRLRNSSVRRPLLEGDLEGNVHRLRQRRDPLYAGVADLTIEVGMLDLSSTSESVVTAIVAAWPDLGATVAGEGRS